MNNRLQKKCVIAAASFHSLLLVTVLFGSAFFTSKEPPRNELQMVEIMPQIITDTPIVTGGDPDVRPPTPAPPAPTPPTPTPPVPPEPPQPTPPKTVTSPERSQPSEPKQETKPSPDSLEPTKKAHVPKINLKLVDASKNKQSQKKKTATNAASEAQAREAREAIASAITSLQKNFSPSTKVGIPGPGGGAFLTAGYENVIQSIYQAEYNRQLASGGDVGERQTEVGVSVTVRRNGSVISSRIIKSSGNPALNKLVQRVLDQVDFIAPFPSTTTDQQRTFNIIFDLKTKKALG